MSGRHGSSPFTNTHVRAHTHTRVKELPFSLQVSYPPVWAGLACSEPLTLPLLLPHFSNSRRTSPSNSALEARQTLTLVLKSNAHLLCRGSAGGDEDYGVVRKEERVPILADVFTAVRLKYR